MQNKEKENIHISENEMLEMIKETSQLVAQKNIDVLSTGAVAIQQANNLTNEVEFWKWMDRNYIKAGIFKNTDSMQQYISQGIGKEKWFAIQVQGKGYEWDWMTKQRNSMKNLFKVYDAGDVVNRAATDVTETNLITQKTVEYQHKAYTGKTNPNLQNTPKEVTIVTNAEKTDVVKKNGYTKVDKFQDSESIKNITDKRLEDVKNGKVQTNYNFKNIAGTMAKAGMIGCAIGMGTEAIFSYKAWKNKKISDEQYLKEILKAGGDAGVTAGVTSGIMIPISTAITVAGGSSVITIPVAIVISGFVNKIVAPCFARGDYRKILSQAKYYQNLENVYNDLVTSMENASNQYYNFVVSIDNQHKKYEEMKQLNSVMDIELEKLYNKI